jgi:hypothetical protein
MDYLLVRSSVAPVTTSSDESWRAFRALQPPFTDASLLDELITVTKKHPEDQTCNAGSQYYGHNISLAAVHSGECNEDGKRIDGAIIWLACELDLLDRSKARFGVGIVTWSLAKQPTLLDLALVTSEGGRVYTKDKGN